MVYFGAVAVAEVAGAVGAAVDGAATGAGAGGDEQPAATRTRTEPKRSVDMAGAYCSSHVVASAPR